VGKSILDRSATVNVGELCLRFGGGGHRAAGTCQVEHDWAPRVLNELIDGIARGQGVEPAATAAEPSAR